MNNTMLDVKTMPLEKSDEAMMKVAGERMRQQKGNLMEGADRDNFNSMMELMHLAKDLIFDPEPPSWGGIHCEWGMPTSATEEKNAALFFIHGGGFVLGAAKSFRNPASSLSTLTSLPVFIPDYRLAPEHPYPAASDDIYKAYKAVKAKYENIIVVGESAGGNLAVVLINELAQKGEMLPKGVALMSPWTDLTLSGKSMTSKAEDEPLFTRESIQHLANLYLKGASGIIDAADPKVSPQFSDFTKYTFPPLRIDVGTDEILLDDSTRLAESIHSANRDNSVQLVVWQGMTHVFPLRPLPTAAKFKSISQIADFIRGCL